MAVERLQASGIETFESCEGGPGHAYTEPTVIFHGIPEAGWRAVGICLAYGLPIMSLRRIWNVSVFYGSQQAALGNHISGAIGLAEFDALFAMGACHHRPVHDAWPLSLFVRAVVMVVIHLAVPGRFFDGVSVIRRYFCHCEQLSF